MMIGALFCAHCSSCMPCLALMPYSLTDGVTSRTVLHSLQAECDQAAQAGLCGSPASLMLLALRVSSWDDVLSVLRFAKHWLLYNSLNKMARVVIRNSRLAAGGCQGCGWAGLSGLHPGLSCMLCTEDMCATQQCTPAMLPQSS